MRLSLGLLFLVAALAGGCGSRRPPSPDPQSASLICYVGPNMRVPMEDLARRYQQRTGVRVSVESADARTLIDRLVASRAADLFVSHDPWPAVLAGKGLAISNAWAVASVKPVIAVPKGNPKSINGLEDLARPGLRVGLTDANNSISGHIVTLMLRKAAVEEKVRANVAKQVLQGRDIADALVAGDVDACIVWNAVVFDLRDKIEAVDIRPEWRPKLGVDAIVNSPTMGRLELDYVRVTVATLGCSKSPEAARAFAEFVASPEGKAAFAANGLSPADPSRPALPKQ